MDDIHVTREIYRAVERNELPRSFLEEVLTDHLLARCAHCRTETAAYDRERQAGPAAWTRILQAFEMLAGRLLAASAREQRNAQRELEELLSLPSEEREDRIAGARSRFRSLDLAELYLKAGRTADVRRLAEEMVAIFQSADLHRESLAALHLFQEAARRDELTIERARQVAAYLKEARTGVGRGFSWPATR